jgi:hypothetical protein
MSLTEKRMAISRLNGYFERIARVFSRDYGVTVELGRAGSVPMADLETKRIYLPADIEFASPEMRFVIEGLLDHETAHIRAEVEFTGEDRCSKLMEKAVETETKAVPDLFNSYEDARAERDASNSWVGVGDNLLRKNLHYYDEHKEKFSRMEEAGGPPPPAAYFMSALNFRTRLGELPGWLPDDIREFAGNFEDLFDRADKAWRPRESFELAKETYERIKELIPPDDPESSLAARILAGMEEGSGESIEDDAWEKVRGELVEMRKKERTYYMPLPAAMKHDCVRTPKASPEQYRIAHAIAKPTIATIVRRLSMWLRAQVPVMMVDQYEGDIDEDALQEIVMGDKRIFEEERPGVILNTAWEILVDQSLSMGSGNTKGTKSYWSRPAAIALGESLHRCGIPFEMWGWDTDEILPLRHLPAAGADGVHTRMGSQIYYKYKAFYESWPRTRRRCGSITGMHENDDVGAIYYAAKRLLKRPETHKVLVVLSDGYPAQNAWCHERFEMWRFQQLKDALELVRKAGVVDIGVGIKSSHVTEFYKHTLVINNLSTFGSELVKLVRKAILSG